MARRAEAIIANEDAEIARLEAICRKRPLTSRESDQLSAMLSRQMQRHRRLAAKIAATRARLACLEAMGFQMGIAA